MDGISPQLAAPWFLGAGFSALVVGVAYRARTLTFSGAVAAWGVGWLTFGSGTWLAALTVLAFFTSSSVLSRWGSRRKVRAAREYAKSARRDGAQVLANGSVATLAALLVWLCASEVAFAQGAGLAFAAALAAATADTWATEVGSAHPRPRHILTGRPVPPGTSGAVSSWGTLAALGGSIWLAGLFVVGLYALPLEPGWMGLRHVPAEQILLSVSVGGVGGSLMDSLLGATLQRVYMCPTCGVETERTRHHCGTLTRPLRGVRWVSNDVVNFLGTLSGSIIAVLLQMAVLGK